MSKRKEQKRDCMKICNWKEAMTEKNFNFSPNCLMDELASCHHGWLSNDLCFTTINNLSFSSWYLNQSSSGWGNQERLDRKPGGKILTDLSWQSIIQFSGMKMKAFLEAPVSFEASYELILKAHKIFILGSFEVSVTLNSEVRIFRSLAHLLHRIFIPIRIAKFTKIHVTQFMNCPISPFKSPSVVYNIEGEHYHAQITSCLTHQPPPLNFFSERFSRTLETFSFCFVFLIVEFIFFLDTFKT